MRKIAQPAKYTLCIDKALSVTRNNQESRCQMIHHMQKQTYEPTINSLVAESSFGDCEPPEIAMSYRYF